MCTVMTAIAAAAAVAGGVMKNKAAKKANNERTAFTRDTIRRQSQAQDKSAAVIDRILEQQAPDKINENVQQAQTDIQDNIGEKLRAVQAERPDATQGGRISNLGKARDARNKATEAAEAMQLARLFSQVQAPKAQSFERAMGHQRGAEEISQIKNFLGGDAAVNQVGFNAVQDNGSVLGDIFSSVGSYGVGQGAAGTSRPKAWTGNPSNLTTTWG